MKKIWWIWGGVLAKAMKRITYITFLGMLVFGMLYMSIGHVVLKILAITFGTSFYHFAMRLLVGCGYQRVLNNQVDYRKEWFQPMSGEAIFYKKIRVKAWKKKLPTYRLEYFDLRQHTYEEVIMATCQSELVHETIIVLSYIPILFTLWFASFWAFFITSLLASGFDFLFVIIQRYNRPRLYRLMEQDKRNA